MIAGYDIGGTKALVLLIDPASGEVIARRRHSSSGSGPDLLARMIEALAELESGASAQIAAVGVAVAGLAHRSGSVRFSPNLPELNEYPLGTELGAALDLPVIIGNDATAGAWAEACLGAGRGASDFLFVALGTGIGTGFVANGQLIRGSNGFAGEAGHMVMDLDGPRHITGQRGPWEYFASGNALGRMAREAALDGRFDVGVGAAGSASAISGFHVVDAMQSGDAGACAIFDRFCCEVARGIADLILILDPERVVLGGGLADIGEPLRGGVEGWLGQLVLGADHRPHVDVVMAEMGSDAGALGAGLLASEAL